MVNLPDVIVIPVAAQWATSRVAIESAVLSRWADLGISQTWFQTAQGPAFWDDDGRPQRVADVITGKPCRLGPKGPNSVELSNIQPLDGSPPTTSGLDTLTTDHKLRGPHAHNPSLPRRRRNDVVPHP